MARWVKDHLNNSDKENGSKSNSTRHGRVVLVPEAAQARVPERDESSGEQMDKSRSNQHTSAEMTYSKEETSRNPQTWELGSHDRESASKRRNAQDDEQGSNMERSVVFSLVDTSSFAGASLAERRDLKRNRLMGLGG